MNPNLSYARQIPADEAFAKYDFSDLKIVDNGRWEVADDATHPDRTLMRTLELDYNSRTYYRVFAVVFDQGTNIEEVSFGDMLP